MRNRLPALLLVSLATLAAAEKSSVVGWVMQCSGDFEDRTHPDHPAYTVMLFSLSIVNVLIASPLSAAFAAVITFITQVPGSPHG